MKLAARTRRSQTSGFTLIEIMVVLVILGLLAAIIVPSVLDRPDEARRVKVQQDLRGLMSALKLYRLDNFRYPSQEQGLAALTRKPADAPNWKGPYVELLPDDPWGKPYLYANPARRGREIDVYSYGADGREGGSGVDQDIGAWDLQ